MSAEADFYEGLAVRLRKLALALQREGDGEYLAFQEADALATWLGAELRANNWWFPHEAYHFISDVDICRKEPAFARAQADNIEDAVRDLVKRAAALRQAT